MGKDTPTKLHVGSWNILIDDQPDTPTLPQHQRCDSLCDSIEAIGTPFDFLGLYEVEGSSSDNCGHHMAKTLGLTHTTWAQNGRPHEGIMLAARKPLDDAQLTVLDPDHSKRAAIIVRQGGTTIVTTHLLYHVINYKWRVKQTESLLEKLAGHDKVVILGDFNCLPSQKPRKLLEANGYTSVLGELFPKRTSTFPTAAYRDISVKPWQNRLIPNGISIDDIYIKNLKLIDGGLFEGNTDHHGLWATLETT